MIIDTKPQHMVESSGELETTTFTIKQSAKAFVVLSSSLYKDKIRSIVRELSSNARDSHVAADKVDTPFDVHLPTSMEPEFWVRDYGTGLSDDGIKNIYTKYFESTKETTDDAVGCLGLGSKSPFAYTQSFMVTSWHDGIKRIYSVFINDSSEPSIAKMLEVATDEPNGVEVRFNVPIADRDKFIFAARRVYTWFNKVKPNFVGQQIDFSTYVEQKNVKDIIVTRYKTGGTVSKCSVVMGEVEYPVDMTNPSVQDISHVKNITDIISNSYNSTISINVPIGTVDFAPSREDLQYTKKTLTSLSKYFSDAKKSVESMIPVFDEKTLAGKTYRESCKMLSEHINSLAAISSGLGISPAFTRKERTRVEDIWKSLLSPADQVAIDATSVKLNSKLVDITNSLPSWTNSTHVVLADVTGEFTADFSKDYPGVVASFVNARSAAAMTNRIFHPDEVAQYQQLFTKLGYTVVLASDLLKVKLKDRKYHTLYRMVDKGVSFSRVPAAAVKHYIDAPESVYWVKLRNKTMSSLAASPLGLVDIARIVDMPFTIVGVYEPSTVDVSKCKEFDEHFIKDLDTWMASAPNRNLFMYNRIKQYDRASNFSLYGDQSHMFNEILAKAGIDHETSKTYSVDDLHKIPTMGRQIYTQLRGIDRYTRHAQSYEVGCLLTSRNFPIAAFKDAHQFQHTPMHNHVANFKQQFANFCDIFKSMEPGSIRRSVIIETGVKIFASFQQSN